VALALDKGLADLSQSQAKTKLIYSQNTKHGPAEPFHLLNMGPMSDVVILRGLCVADFGHATPLWHLCLTKIWQTSVRAKPKPSLFTARTPSMALLNHFICSIWVQ
jgi:hypothetical protein